MIVGAQETLVAGLASGAGWAGGRGCLGWVVAQVGLARAGWGCDRRLWAGAASPGAWREGESFVARTDNRTVCFDRVASYAGGKRAKTVANVG